MRFVMAHISSSSSGKRLRAILLILVFYVLPPVAILVNIIPFQYRFPLLMALTPVMMLVKPDRETTLADLGITLRNSHKSIVTIIPLTILLILPMLVVSLTASTPRIDNSSLPVAFYAFYIFISCPFQEFAYRGYLFRLMQLLSLGKWSRILIGAALYSFVHIIYQDVWTLIFTLFAGILWNIHYDKFRNLASVTFSHIVLGTITILLGFI